MTTQYEELRRLVDELENPLGDLSGGVQVLSKLSEGVDTSDEAALAFLANALDAALEKIHETHSGLLQALRPADPNTGPTLVHSA